MTKQNTREWRKFLFSRRALPDGRYTYERRRSFDNRRVFADIDNNIVENPVHERRLSKGFLDEILYLQTYGGKPQMQIANKSKTPYV